MLRQLLAGRYAFYIVLAYQVGFREKEYAARDETHADLAASAAISNAHAFNGSGGMMGGRMGGKMGMPQPTAEEAGGDKTADMNPEAVGAPGDLALHLPA
jgi:hypothetical protein